LFRQVFLNIEPESSRLHRHFILGIGIMMLGVSSSVGVALWQGLWEFKIPPRRLHCEHCEKQWANRTKRLADINRLCEISEHRRRELTNALSNPQHPAFSTARRELEAEVEFGRQCERDAKSLSVQPLHDFAAPAAIGLILITGFSLLTARLAVIHGSSALPSLQKADQPLFPSKRYWCWVALVFIPHASREVGTSILAIEKSWFAWSSFCISPAAWTLMQVAALGVSMIIAYPAAVLWESGNYRGRRIVLDVGHIDGQWGVGAYVLFLQTWTLLCLFSLVLPTAVWLRLLRTGNRMSGAYLVITVVLFASALSICGRMLASAVAIRRLFAAQLAKLGATWQQIQACKPPPDPTIPFLGEHWWKLPAIVFGIGAASWSVLEMFGVADYLTKLAGLK